MPELDAGGGAEAPVEEKATGQSHVSRRPAYRPPDLHIPCWVRKCGAAYAVANLKKRARAQMKSLLKKHRSGSPPGRVFASYGKGKGREFPKAIAGQSNKIAAEIGAMRDNAQNSLRWLAKRCVQNYSV